MKLALDGEPEVNEGSVQAKNTVYEDPGEGKDLHEPEPMKRVDGHDEPFHDRESIHRESTDVRCGVLGREFTNFKAQQGNEGAVMAANFAHVRSGDFESHSALLQPKTKTGSLSLADRVKKLVG